MHTEGDLRSDRLAAYFVAHPGTLRRDPDAEDCAGARAGAGSHSDSGHEADTDYARPCQFLARALSTHQIRVAAEISETSVAMKLRINMRSERARPASLLSGNLRPAISGTRAASAWSSPSNSASRLFSRAFFSARAVAACILPTDGCMALPLVEKESRAT